MIKAVIFDYNGTLYYDRDINIGGWRLFYKDVMKTEEGSEEFAKNAINMSNYKCITNLYKKLNKKIDDKQISALSYKKESYYHQLALENKRFELADGVEKVLKYIKDKNIKLNLCTASIQYNLDFYFQITNLDKYFDKSLVAYDDGFCKNKIDMYKIAASNIGVDPKDCIVFEDSKNSINDAIKAGYNKIVYVNHYNNEQLKYKEIIQDIKDYSELNYSIFD